MEAWLSTNRGSYEWYLLHAMLHDRSRALKMLTVPLMPSDFSDEPQAVMYSAIRSMHSLAPVTSTELYPPDFLALLDALNTACTQEACGPEVLEACVKQAAKLMAREHMERRWSVIDAYFETWLTSHRAKVLSRQAQISKLPNSEEMIRRMQSDLAAARAAIRPEVDEMDLLFDSEDEDAVVRRPTGILPLDLVLNGGWGEKECYLIFSGTGGGKSILAGQCAWSECNNDGWPLIVSTELQTYEYLARILSCACSIPINVLQDAKNFKQMRIRTYQDPALHNRIRKLEEAHAALRARWRVHKVRGDDGLNAKALLETHALRFEEVMKRPPTLVILDWLGTLADQSVGGMKSSERAQVWEHAANGCVSFAELTGIPTVVLAQGTNDCQLHRVLTQQQIAVGKGILKQMTAGFGVTNYVDKESIAAAVKGNADMPKLMTPPEQLLCPVKARKGEGVPIPIMREFQYQRFSVVVKK